MKRTERQRKGDTVIVTPFLGGKSDEGVCSLLEVNGFNILLDCGVGSRSSMELLSSLQSHLSAREATLDAILITHADMQHMGSLPVVLGKQGFSGCRVFCTLPVHKFGQMLLYDKFLNQEMEGLEITKTRSEYSGIGYDLDDVDMCLSFSTILKYNQKVEVKSSHHPVPISLCAFSSGRTIGGSMWCLIHGATEILYIMDVNLKKEVVLDGADLRSLPLTPSLVIVDSGGLSGVSSLRGGHSSVVSSRKKDSDPQVLLSSVLETVRENKNVLLPCETAGRALEIIQILSAYWASQKLGMYHLVFLSPMAHNVLEFARSQLEWMSDSLSKSFYMGKPNPFHLADLKECTSVRELDKKYPGPKVVIATDASLSCGCAKELLLRWGGDPGCRVIFTDSSASRSLAAELRTQSPPIVATVTKPLRVELVGEELAAYRLEEERRRREVEEAALRKRREDELELLANARDGDDETDDEEEEEDGVDAEDKAVGGKRRKLQASLISKFVQPDFPMFDSVESARTVDEFGMSIDDLNFQDITTAQIVDRKNSQVSQSAPKRKSHSTSEGPEGESGVSIPTKLVATTIRVQFTCSIKEVALGARADQKAVKTIVSRISPARLVVIRGSPEHCDDLVHYAKERDMQAYAPANLESVEMNILEDCLRIELPQSLMSPDLKTLNGKAPSFDVNSVCVVSTIGGLVRERADSGRLGIRTVRLVQGSAEEVTQAEAGPSVDVVGDESDEEAVLECAVGMEEGAVSVGEVHIDTLKSRLEAAGMAVEFRREGGETQLVCGGQVIIRKNKENDFLLEGPPVPAYFEARRIIYEYFTFV